MQSYVLNLATTSAVRAFDVPADLFVYESGAPTPTTGDMRIKVKPNTGAEMVLRPGQRFRLAPGSEATHWEVSALDPSVLLTGYVIIGSGEFDDANTLNKVQLDATFANVVKVNNTTAERIPVNLDPNQLLQSTAPIMAYTNASQVTGVGPIAVQLLAPGANANGVIIEALMTSSGIQTVVAKTSLPANGYDGDVLSVNPAGVPYGSRVKVPAGKGVYAYITTGTVVVQMLYTVL